jgi:hypothetical protein
MIDAIIDAIPALVRRLSIATKSGAGGKGRSETGHQANDLGMLKSGHYYVDQEQGPRSTEKWRKTGSVVLNRIGWISRARS